TRRMLHNSDADIAGEFIRQHTVTEINKAPRSHCQACQAKLKRHQPPECGGQWLLMRDQEVNRVNNQSGHYQNAERNQSSNHSAKYARSDNSRRSRPHHPKHRGDIAQGRDSFLPLRVRVVVCFGPYCACSDAHSSHASRPFITIPMLSRRESSGRFFPARKASSDRGVKPGQAERDEKTRKSRLSDSASNPPARSYASTYPRIADARQCPHLELPQLIKSKHLFIIPRVGYSCFFARKKVLHRVCRAVESQGAESWSRPFCHGGAAPAWAATPLRFAKLAFAPFRGSPPES